MSFLGFIGDAVKAVTGSLNKLADAVGLGKINDMFSSMGGLAGVIAKLTSATSNPLAAMGVLKDVFGALSANKDQSSKPQTDSFGKGLLGTLQSIGNFVR